MALTLREASAINEMAGLLYEFLPGSGNSSTSFPIAAAKAGVSDFWTGGSKRPALVQLLSLTLERRRNKFCLLVQTIVHLSMSWRSGKGNPLRREEVERLNALLLRIEFRIKELCDPKFLGTLAQVGSAADRKLPDAERSRELLRDFMALTLLEPRPRGYAFEKFLCELFESYRLAPRSAFRLTGEQIDGSFQLDGATYLLEAKWQNPQTGVEDLHAFSGKIGTKAQWARGAFISYGGFTSVGLQAFSRARTSIVLMDGLDLHETLDRGLGIDVVLARKIRRAAETGESFSRVRDLFPT